MKKTLTQAWLLLFLLTPALMAGAEVPTVKKPPKYLFLVDTSLSFEPYKRTVRNKLYDLLSQGLDQRLKDGDTFTIWTFSDVVNTKGYPVIEWNQSQKEEIAIHAYEHLKDIPFGGANRWVPAQIQIFSAIKSLPQLTVIVISDGFRKFEGTPFDDNINRVYQRHAVEFRNAGKPFITTLVGYKGKIVGAAVNTVGEPLHDPTPESLLSEETETTAGKSDVKQEKPAKTSAGIANAEVAKKKKTSPAKKEVGQKTALTAKADTPSSKPMEAENRPAPKEAMNAEQSKLSETEKADDGSLAARSEDSEPEKEISDPEKSESIETSEAGKNPPVTAANSEENLKVETQETEFGNALIITSGKSDPAGNASTETKSPLGEGQPEPEAEAAQTTEAELPSPTANQVDQVAKELPNKPDARDSQPASPEEENPVSKAETKIAAIPDSDGGKEAEKSEELLATPDKKSDQPASGEPTSTIASREDSKPSFLEPRNQSADPIVSTEKTANTPFLPDYPANLPGPAPQGDQTLFLILGGVSLLAACALLGALLLRFKPSSHQPSIITQSFQVKR